VVVGGAGLVVVRSRSRGLSTATLDRDLPTLTAFVERTRGLRFLHRPKVQLLGDHRFDQVYSGGDQPGSPPDQRADDAAYAGLLRALGLVQGDVDFDSVDAQEARDIVGFYDSDTKVLYVRGHRPTAYVEDVVVHELTHALDDQHFGIDHEPADDDGASAYDALIEGSAMIVEDRWFDSRSRHDQAVIEKEDGGAPTDGASGEAQQGPPDVFGALDDFPYDAGPDFVQALLDDGGQARLDHAFVDPPATTEQVMHPDRYLAREGARAVAAPPADGPVADDGTLGELMLQLVVQESVDHDRAVAAAAGWGGDHYVTWTDGNRTCVRLNVVMDSDRDTDELLVALRSWTADHAGAAVTGTDPVTLVNCA
jgi:hypothetical protein